MLTAILTAFKATHDHCNVPIGWPENPQLRTWVNEQRKRKKKGTLSEDCIQRLNQIGLVWDAYDTSWEERFAELTAFKATHGHCNVPIGWSENPQLGTWVNEQRKRKKKGTLSGNRTQRLNQIGLVWDTLNAAWEEKFSELKVFKKSHGHCNVPDLSPENPQLASWIGIQRASRKKGKLSEERICRLEEIGFVWDALDALWEQRFTELEEFKATYGHCNVPDRWSENPKLASWIGTQRQCKKQGTLTEERIQRLSQIGFVWEPHNASWEERFGEIEIFKATYGHCNVPMGWSENPQLAKWVSHQRNKRKQGKLSEERIQRLSKIEFVWNLKNI
jgi:hypothetical protein